MTTIDQNIKAADDGTQSDRPTVIHHYHSGWIAVGVTLIILGVFAMMTLLAIFRPDLVTHL